MKKRTHRGRTLAEVLLVALAAGTTSSAGAQTRSDETRFRATVYGYFPGLSGTTEFPSGAGGPSIDIDSKDILEDLKMAFMGTLEVQSGRWGGLVDWVYADIGSEKSGTREFSIHGQQLPAGLNANLNLDVKTNILTLAGTYSFIETPYYNTGLVFGARMLDMDNTLDWSFVGTGPAGIARTGRSEVSSTNWDAIIGMHGRARFDSELAWFVPHYVDIGTGYSKLTWQAIAGLGYSFGWGDVVTVWRYLDYDFDSGEAAQSLTFNGVAIGLSFRF
jgi:hypothetical protein